jgi:integrase
MRPANGMESQTTKWNGDDVADFISLSIYTGLRISDVALFNVDRMLPNGEIRVCTTKAGTHVYSWAPKWLQDRIRERAKKHGPRIFGEHTTKSLDVITELWRRKLNLVWQDCGKWKVKPTPHRFRHTFARICAFRCRKWVRCKRHTHILLRGALFLPSESNFGRHETSARCLTVPIHRSQQMSDF